MMRVCNFDQTQVADGEPCPSCMERWPNLPDPKAMTPDERVAEMKSYDGPLQVPFSMLHERIERLVGRSVWTHEFGLRWDDLVEEARWQPGDASLDHVMAPLEALGKPVIVMQQS